MMSNSSAPITSADEWRKYQEAKRSGKPYEPPPAHAPASEAQHAEDEMWIDSAGRWRLGDAVFNSEDEVKQAYMQMLRRRQPLPPQSIRHTVEGLAGFAAMALIVVFVGYMIYQFTKPLTPLQKLERQEAATQREARARVLAVLKDPGGAEFRAQSGICGQVNAKNSFGVYTGFEQFIATDRLIGVVFERQFPAEQFDDLWNTLC